MSAKTIEMLERCSCGRQPSNRAENVNGFTLHWVACECGLCTVKYDDAAEALSDWNEGWVRPVNEEGTAPLNPEPLTLNFEPRPPLMAAEEHNAFPLGRWS